MVKLASGEKEKTWQKSKGNHQISATNYAVYISEGQCELDMSESYVRKC